MRVVEVAATGTRATDAELAHATVRQWNLCLIADEDADIRDLPAQWDEGVVIEISPMQAVKCAGVRALGEVVAIDDFRPAVRMLEPGA